MQKYTINYLPKNPIIHIILCINKYTHTWIGVDSAPSKSQRPPHKKQKPIEMHILVSSQTPVKGCLSGIFLIITFVVHNVLSLGEDILCALEKNVSSTAV